MENLGILTKDDEVMKDKGGGFIWRKMKMVMMNYESSIDELNF